MRDLNDFCAKNKINQIKTKTKTISTWGFLVVVFVLQCNNLSIELKN